MKRDSSMYRRAAQLIVEAEDPRYELLLMAQLETEHLRRRSLIRGVSIASAALILIGVAWFALRPGAEDKTDPSQWTVYQQAEWALEQNRMPSHVPLQLDVEARLQTYLRSPSSRVRRAALIALLTRGADVDPRIISEFIRGVPESIDIPVPVASADGEDAQRALETKRKKTMRAGTRAAWMYCARHHAFPDIQALEDALLFPDVEVQRYVIRALSELPNYRLPAALRERVNESQPAVVEEAGELLRRGRKER